MLFAQRVANQRHIILMKVMVSAMLVLNVVGKTSQTLNDSVYYLLEICVWYVVITIVVSVQKLFNFCKYHIWNKKKR